MESNNPTKFLILTGLLVFALAAATPALAVGDTLHADEASAENDRFSDVTVSEHTLLDDAVDLLNPLSYVATGKATVTPGGDQPLEWEVDTDWETGFGPSTGEALFIIEIYDCEDNTCDTGSGDQFVEAIRKPVDEFVFNGQSFDGSATYNVPDDADGWWAATAYIWHTEFKSDGKDNDGDGSTDEADEALISDTPVTKFEVTTRTSGGSGGTDGSTGDTGSPNILECGAPSVQVRNGQVDGSVCFENVGDADMQQSHIVEMQVRPHGQGPLSWSSGFTWSSNQVLTCDSTHPENVHKQFQIDQGDQLEIDLSAPIPDHYQTDRVDVYFVTRSTCAGNDGYERVSPYKLSESIRGVCAGSCGIDDENSSDDDNNGSNIPATAMWMVAGVVVIAVGWRLSG